ncbi:MAG: carboxypeptidase-like regulatory domain-containing protein [Burkholderiaceae bacterium]|jgi:hypothetical protein|nr:carboxypeptidase-like regulatory domain-containing protein [Burkholderiaceae bacterium]
MRARLNPRFGAGRLLAAALLWSALLPSLAAQSLTGTVTDAGKPLADVAVVAEADGRGFGTARTDAQGQFAIPLSPAGNARDFAVTFSKTGFRGEVRRLDRSAAGRPLQVGLLAATGLSAISAQDQEKLLPLKTLDGTGPLMFVPYALPGDGSGGQATAAANQRLRLQLQRLIVTHVQGTVGSAGVSITALPVDANNDIARLQAIGHFVNALGVVSGMGLDDGSGQSMELSSSFVIIPRAKLFEPPVLNIIDTVPARKLGLSALDQSFSRMWGRATVLALAARDLKVAEEISGVEARRAELKRVRAYLVAERSTVGPSDAIGTARLNDLIDRVTRELGP